MTRAGTLLAALLLGLCCPRSLLAASRELEWRLSYRADPGCPGANTFLSRLEEFVGYGGSNYLDGRVALRRIDERTFRLLMQFNGGRLEKVDGEDCAALMEVAVRTAGLARTDSPSARVAAILRRSAEQTRDHVAWDAPAARASVVPASMSSDFPAQPSEREARSPAPEDSSAAERAGDANAGRWSPSVLARTEYVSGALPRPALGAGLALAVAHQRLQARIEATLWPAQPWRFLSGPRPVEVSLRQASVALGLCSDLARAEPGLGRLLLEGCVRGAFVRLESLASREYSGGSKPYGTLGSRLGLTWLHAGLVIELLGGLDVAGGEPALVPSGGGARFVAQSSQLSASLAVGWRWGTGSGDTGSGKEVASAE